MTYLKSKTSVVVYYRLNVHPYFTINRFVDNNYTAGIRKWIVACVCVSVYKHIHMYLYLSFEFLIDGVFVTETRNT